MSHLTQNSYTTYEELPLIRWGRRRLELERLYQDPVTAILETSFCNLEVLLLQARRSPWVYLNSTVHHISVP